MRRALEWIGIALLLVVVLLAAVIAINAFDEDLDPKAASAGAPRAPSVPDAENGYYALLALGADDGADGAVYAKAWVAEARAAARDNRTKKRAEPKRAKRPVLCDSAQASCLAAVRANAEEIKTQLEAYKEDIERYEKLIAFKRYEEVLDFPQRVVSLALPSYGLVASAQKAHLLRAALAVESNNLEDAVTAVERDMAFLRSMIADSRWLAGKMTAAAAFWRDLAFVADVLCSRGVEMAPYVPRLREILKPLSDAALSFSSVLESEFAIAKSELSNPFTDERHGLPGLFYKPNATINLAYRRYVADTRAAEAPAHRVAAEFLSAGQSLGEMRIWDYIDNLIGNSLVKENPPRYGDYALVLHDLDSYKRLIGLWVEMIAAGVGAAGASEFVAKSEPRFHDPYTQKPMRWDAEKKRVYFEAQANISKRRTAGMEDGKVFIAP